LIFTTNKQTNQNDWKKREGRNNHGLQLPDPTLLFFFFFFFFLNNRTVFRIFITQMSSFELIFL